MVYLFERCSDTRVSSAIRQSHVLVRNWLLMEGCACCRYVHSGSIRMNWVRAIAAVLVLWSGTAWSATLTWNANSEPDLAGYRVYQCSRQPCTRSSANASLLATLGKVTSFNIGSPSVIQYYFTTAVDSADNESGSSNLAIFTPAGAPPPPPPPPSPAAPPTPNGLRITGLQ